MERINTINKDVDLFGAGKHGFKDGDPVNGIFATFFAAAWCNSVQEELANLVEGAGIALNAADRSQLLAAIAALRTAAFSGSNQSLAASGYQKLPGGLIIQWGSLIASGTTQNVTYPIAFTVGAYIVLAGDSGATRFVFSALNQSATQLGLWNEFAGNSVQWFAIGK